MHSSQGGDIVQNLNEGECAASEAFSSSKRDCGVAESVFFPSIAVVAKALKNCGTTTMPIASASPSEIA